MICFSESFESLSAVPREHRTDSLTTAVHKLSHPEEFTERYRQLLDHYGLEATHSQAGQPTRTGMLSKHIIVSSRPCNRN